MTSKLTREQLHERARENVKALKMASRQHAFESAREEILADLQLAELALAAMDSEPVAIVEPSDYVTAAQLVGEGPVRKAVHELYEGALRIGDKLYRHAQPAKGLELAGWQFKSVNGDWLGLIDEHGKNQAVRDGYEVREVFAMADGVNDRDQVRREHAEWSQATFGNVGPVGPLKHLAKEAIEAAAEPDDLSEWADMQFLMWDAQRRAGITDEQITKAMIDKLAVNKQRSWPEPKDGEPRLHIKEQPAPVVPVVPATLPCSVELKPGLIIGKGCKTETLLTALRRRADYNADIDAMTPEERAEHDASIKAFKAMLTAAPQLPGSEPATVPGKWIPVSERMPEDRMSVILWDAEIGEVTSGHYSHKTQTFYHCGDAIGNEITHWMPPPAAPQEPKP